MNGTVQNLINSSRKADYETIPASAGEESQHYATLTRNSSSSADISGRRRATIVKWTVAALVVALFLAVALPVAVERSNLRSASLVTQRNNDHVKELYYNHQKVDHFRGDIFRDETPQTWSQRYYQTTQYFKGPGHPIFVILGGEDVTDFGFFYPFVTEHLAPHFGAAVLQPEHRFYGRVKPVENATTQQLLQLLTVEQALADVVDLTQYVAKHHLHCNMHDRSSPNYCPIIPLGGSYPGFLAAMLRIVYPEFIDMAYCSSGPILMYGQIPDPNVYYDILTAAADKASPGCKDAVKHVLYATVDAIRQSNTLAEAAMAVDVCPDKIPTEINSTETLADALMQLASFKFQ